MIPENQMNQGFQTAFINNSINSNVAYKPQFISNDHKAGRKVLVSIERELVNCEEFFISVAFITQSGITPLLQTLKELEKKHIPGKILTTDYLCFSEPKALQRLSELTNIEIKMYCVEEGEPGFHTKGYIFREEELYRIIIGSSNMTLSALTKNKEWNTKIVSSEQGEYAREILKEFNQLWNSNNSKSLKSWIDTYTEIYEMQKKIARSAKVMDMAQYRLEPNSMQVSFVQELINLKAAGEKKALLISATGTGKTYASAFALRSINPEKILFLVHREQIARQAMKSYQRVFGSTKKMGMLSGNHKEMDADFLFSTIQMMARPEIYKSFSKKGFQIIVIDEVHRAGAFSYQTIMDYFEPEIYLGMTASPDRTDDFDIYNLFDHNIAYEIRLQQALEEELLCPFHYFGISDIEIDGESFDDISVAKKFKELTSETRVKYIMEKADYFGFSGSRIKGLMFCSSREEGIKLSLLFNTFGLRSVFLSGDDSQIKREEMIERLVSDEREDILDYIITVDIFNEGVDIPEINQVIMLRPTQSPIVFIQQLGRGLRKAEGKEYVVIIDFIGNYSNNFMIPIALSGDRSYNKDTIRKYLQEGTSIIPGSSSIHFDQISKSRIYQSIDTAKLNDVRLLKESYTNLKYKLGHIPTISDFAQFGAIDITKYFDKFGSYYTFLIKYESDYVIRLSKEEEQIIVFLSQKIAKGKRIHELEMLSRMQSYSSRLIDLFRENMLEKYNIQVNELEITSTINNLTNSFGKEEERKKFNECVFLDRYEDEYYLSQKYQTYLANHVFKEMVLELLEYGKSKYKDEYSDRYLNTNLRLYQKYTYEDVCRLLNWSKNMNAQNIGGYFYEKETKTMPVFINYDKAEGSIPYQDRFLSPDTIIALSKHPRKITSSDADHIYNADKEGNSIFLFIRKNKEDNEAKEFYFLGKIRAIGEPQPIKMQETKDEAFEITYQLDVPVRDDLFDYFIKG